ALVRSELAAPLYVRDKGAFTTAEREQGHGGNPKAAPAALPAAVLAPMTEADLDEVAALEAQVQAFPWTRGNFADALAAGYETRVLRVDGELAGFCVAMLAPDVAHLLVIAVARSRHRQGLGAMLLDWCVQCAREPPGRHAREPHPRRGHPARAGQPAGKARGAGRSGAAVPRTAGRRREKAICPVAAEGNRRARRAPA